MQATCQRFDRAERTTACAATSCKNARLARLLPRAKSHRRLRRVDVQEACQTRSTTPIGQTFGMLRAFARFVPFASGQEPCHRPLGGLLARFLQRERVRPCTKPAFSCLCRVVSRAGTARRAPPPSTPPRHGDTDKSQPASRAVRTVSWPIDTVDTSCGAARRARLHDQHTNGRRPPAAALLWVRCSRGGAPFVGKRRASLALSGVACPPRCKGATAVVRTPQGQRTDELARRLPGIDRAKGSRGVVPGQGGWCCLCPAYDPLGPMFVALRTCPRSFAHVWGTCARPSPVVYFAPHGV